MPVVDCVKNTEDLSLTIVAELAAPVERVWRIWSDPRQLERWWGPPTWPATFQHYDFRPGGRARYYMTGPEGQRAHGWWELLSIEAPTALTFRDGFAHPSGEPVDPDDTFTCVVMLDPMAGGTRMTTRTTFRSTDQLDQHLAMGAIEGMTGAAGQIARLLEEVA
ncbi:SRPBCC domain-containing protein [Georgenia halophila]|uniref:SRPBCC domain-containing protein n=1 Tax=Georgenia halophila TaxID=620889 RepID=A0ABP8LLB8_9MICO